jgi:hypothetical protein
MLATEDPTHPEIDRDPNAAPLETQERNERMRHVPTADWMVTKLQNDLRKRLEILWTPYADLSAGDPRHEPIEAQFRLVCRALERVAEVARRHKTHPHPPNDLGSRLPWTIQQAATALQNAADEGFGHRFPFHTGERSNSEPLWGAFLKVIGHVQKLTELVRAIDPSLDERLYEDLVHLREPLRREPMA